jgi:hypothetical protein
LFSARKYNYILFQLIHATCFLSGDIRLHFIFFFK